MKNDNTAPALTSIETLPPMMELLSELRAGLATYWNIATDILQECEVTVVQPTENDFSSSKNFFSLLFLYSFYSAGIRPERRILYSAVLQCLRGMVTGCDNLLDNEYKMTLNTDIPQTGHRFRSVIDIMISDRVLFRLLFDAGAQGDIDREKISLASAVSMKSMTKSGIQEASEETGVEKILVPDSILSTVHHFKTGVLFTCPWDIPEVIEKIEPSQVKTMKKALYAIGMGCQIMDDIVDIGSDISMKRHNYLVSHIFHGDCEKERRRLQEYLRLPRQGEQQDGAFADFPRSVALACATAKDFLHSGLSGLFRDDHSFLISPAMEFLQRRIGVDFERAAE